MYNIKDPRQRLDVAAVIEELSGLATLVSATIVPAETGSGSACFHSVR
jgi:hypothetical protein